MSAAAARRPPLDDFMRDLDASGIAPATPEDYRRARTTAEGPGDPAAIARVFRAHIGLAVLLARRLAGPGAPLADLFAAAYHGLLQAVADFDPDRGVKFGTYAHHRIFYAAHAARFELCHPFSMAAEAQSMGGRYRRAAGRLKRAGDEASDPRAVAAAAGILRRKARYARTAALALGRSTEPADRRLVAPPVAGEPGRDASDRLAAALGRMPAIEAEILARRYGLGGRRPEVLREIAADLGRTKQRISQIGIRAHRRLRAMLTRPQP